MKKEFVHELLGYQNIKIIQRSDMFSFSLDSMLIADFVKVKPNTKNIIDLGCGNGAILLYLTLKTSCDMIGLEIQEEVFDLAKRSVALNDFEDQITIINGDIKGVSNQLGNDEFSIVVSNPPFFKYLPSSNVNKNKYLTIARHEVLITLEELIYEASKLLTNGGSFYLVHRTERLADIISNMRKYKIEPKRIRFVYQKIDSLDSSTVLIEGIKGANVALKVEKPLYVYDGDKYTEEVLNIFNFQKSQD